MILDDVGQILAYFSVTFKELLLQGVSRSEAKKLDGIDKNAESVRAFLIGQIGKNYNVKANPIKLTDILTEAFSVIGEARELVGGRVVFLECEDNEKLIKLYESQGFKLMDISPQDDSGLLTMYINIKD